MICEALEVVMLKSMPEPVSVTSCGPFAAESVSAIVPERAPDEVGVKVTWMAQVPPFAVTMVQLLVSAKSPVAWRLATENDPLPELVRVIVWAVLGLPTVSAVKLRLETLSWALPAKPVPLRLTTCGLPCALSPIVRVPF